MTLNRHTLARVGILTSILACSGGAAVLADQIATSAQGPQGLLGDVVSSLTRLAEAVNTLQASVDGVQRTLDAAAAETTQPLYTPALTFESGIAWCSVVNVSDAFLFVRTELFIHETKFIGGRTGIAPGRRAAYGARADQVLGGGVRCRFEVIDGTNADFRANLQIDGADGNPVVVVAPH